MAFSCTLKDNGGSGGSGVIYYDPEQDAFFSDLLLQNEITAVTVPTRNGYTFKGYFNNTSGDKKYINTSGSIPSALHSRTWTANITLYAIWARSSYIITLDDNGGSGGPGQIYYAIASGKWYTDDALQNEIHQGDALTQPRKNGKKSAGYYQYDGTTWGTRIIGTNGVARSEMFAFVPTGDTVFLARWYNVYTITLDDGDGDGGAGAIYWCSLSGVKYCSDKNCDLPISSVSIPTQKYWKFQGYFSASSGGTKYIASTGSFLSAIPETISGNTTWFAQYTRFSFHINIKGTPGGNKSIYTDKDGGRFFKDWLLTHQISSLNDIGLPTRECFVFYGAFKDAAFQDASYITTSGEWNAAFLSLTFSSNLTIYTRWRRVSYKVTIGKDGGTGGTSAVYVPGPCETVYSDDQLTHPITAIETPTRGGYAFAGAWQSAGKVGTKFINSNGTFPSSFKELTLSADTTIYCGWSGQIYLLTFDYNGGSGSTPSKTVTMGSAIGTLPSATHNRATFDGWYLNGNLITASTIWNVAGNATAKAAYTLFFGQVVDYFNMASATLVPIASDSGDNRQRVCAYELGRCNASEVSSVWRNPTVTYAVVGNMTLNVTLGKAFDAQSTGFGPSLEMAVSGYMITTAKVHTQVGKFPTVTISAAANEGKDAINLFPFSVDIVARSKAQNLLGAISGGGKLNSMSVVASCDPVVVAENMMPVASDVVHGKITASADIISISNENAPTASGGFVEIGTPKQGTDAYYTKWHIDAERDM